MLARVYCLVYQLCLESVSKSQYPQTPEQIVFLMLIQYFLEITKLETAVGYLSITSMVTSSSKNKFFFH